MLSFSLPRAALALLLSAAACAAQEESERKHPPEAALSYAVSHWDAKNGLPLDKVRALAQTPDGFLWVATYNGLARFDGVQFRVFDVENTPALRNNRIESLSVDEAKRLWIGDSIGGLSWMANGQFHAVAVPPEWSDRPVLRLGAGRAGVVWAVNDEGSVLEISHGTAGPMHRLQHVSPNLFAVDRNGEAWIILGGRLCHLEEGAGPVPMANGPHFEAPVLAVFPARAGGLWILDHAALRRWDGQVWAEDRGRHPWGTVVHAAFVETQSGWIVGGSFKEGVSILKPDGSMERMNDADGLADNWAYCLLEDRENNLWIGSGNGGLDGLARRRVTMIEPPDRWRSSAVLSVAPAAAGGLWVGTEGGGVYRLRAGAIESLPGSERLWHSVANSVLEDRIGRVWVGSWASGLWCLQDGEFKSAWDGTHNRDIVLALFESSNGEIWAGTRTGPAVLRNGRWQRYDRDPALAHATVRCFAEQPKGTLWCGLDGQGIARIGPDGVSLLGSSSGLPDNFVRTLAADSDGALWIGTPSALSRYKNGKVSNLTRRNGLPSDAICQILDDDQGHLWIGSFGGLFRVTKSDLNRCADGKTAWVDCLLCDRSNGLATLALSEQGQPACCRTSEGRLWFATGRGLARVDPAEIHANSLPAPVYIEEMLRDDIPLTPDGGGRAPLRVGPGAGRLEFRYAGVSLADPARVAFRYQLRGLEPDWVDAGPRRTAMYSNLSPGSYVFQVTARNADGVWNAVPSEMRFRVLPHFWQTWWFQPGVWIGTVGLMSVAVRAVVRRRAHRRLDLSERQRALEHERGRIARDIHDDLGGSLTRIVMLSEPAGDLPDARSDSGALLGEINQTARDLTLKMSEVIWAVNPEHDTLDSLANFAGKFACDFLAGAGIRCRLDIPISLPPHALAPPLRHGLFLALKEALHNVVKHSGATAAVVTLSWEDDRLELSVTDDGRGFDSEKAPRSGAQGLRNLRHRLEDLGGWCRIESTSGKGCRIRLSVPLRPDL